MSDDVSSRLRVMTPPVSEPVSLSEAKLFLRIEHAAEDAVITRAIASAREACEHYLGSALLPQSLSFTGACDGRIRLMLPFGPATAIDAVTVTDDAGAETELVETDYRLSIDGYSVFFDTAPSGAFVTVEYVAALADTANALPALLKQGILHHVGAWMEQREGAAPMPLASLACYQPYRRVRL